MAAQQQRDSPPLKIYEHSRNGLRTVFGPPSYEEDKETGVTINESVDIIHYSENGEFVAIYVGDTLTIYKTEDGSVVSSVVHPKIKMIHFSPKNTFIQTWQYVEKLANPNDRRPDNLIVWEVETGERIHSCFEKHFSKSNWPIIKWTSDESIAGKMSNGKVNFYAGKHFAVTIRVLKIANIAHFSWAPGDSIPHRFIVFVPEKKGQPGKVQMCQYPETGNVLVQKSIFKAQDADVVWNKQGTAALLISQTDVDTSGKSYYGETGVHLLTLNPNTCQNVRPSLDKMGPIYECVWSPKGDKFVVVYGSMPSKTTLFNLKLERLMDFPVCHRNTAIFCPHGHTLIIAGYGNLQGDTDVWDVKRGKMLSSFKAPCTTECKWSPCSSYIMTSTLTPRLRQDNGWKIWTSKGEIIKEHAVEQLFHTNWRPIEANRYPNRPPKAADSKAVVEKPKPAPSVYRPPHARNRAPEQPKQVTPVTAQKYVPKSQQKQVATPIGQLSKSAAKNKRRKEKKKQMQQRQESEQKKEQVNKETSGESKDTTVADTPKEQPKISSDENEKKRKVKAINKKLRQIEQLKAKQSQGIELNEQETKKIQSEKTLLQELSSYS